MHSIGIDAAPANHIFLDKNKINKLANKTYII